MDLSCTISDNEAMLSKQLGREMLMFVADLYLIPRVMLLLSECGNTVLGNKTTMMNPPDSEMTDDMCHVQKQCQRVTYREMIYQS